MAKEQNRSFGRSGEGRQYDCGVLLLGRSYKYFYEQRGDDVGNDVDRTAAQRMRRVMARPGATGTSNRGRTTAVKLGA